MAANPRTVSAVAGIGQDDAGNLLSNPCILDTCVLGFFGTHGQSPVNDTGLQRVSAGVLSVVRGANGSALGSIAIMTKAGIPTDADFAAAPPIGTMVFDTTDVKLYVRTGANVWKGTAALV